ncbi:hypothetical protein OUZ56_001574 [Daphnia magna]|uniref:Uncharacterized protein n=1 Tax=Daphnia magna TaxID=35525 RepID=A0ABR0A3J8_9CRUS|nr:hypothetical protein OUZ56_001574 [Daphnia magna]
MPPLRGLKGWSRDHPTEPMKTLEMVPFSGTDLSVHLIAIQKYVTSQKSCAAYADAHHCGL